MKCNPPTINRAVQGAPVNFVDPGICQDTTVNCKTWAEVRGTVWV